MSPFPSHGGFVVRWVLPAMAAWLVSVTPSFATSQDFRDDPAVERSPERVDVIAFGSCALQSSPQPIWDAVLGSEPDVWVWAGDNIYNRVETAEAIAANWEQLSNIAGYRQVRDAVRSVLGTWDDHDFGRNDAGSEFPLRAESQQLFLDFVGVASDSTRREREGVYHAATFGPAGQRVQVILLDTRYHRSELERYTQAPGERRAPYKPSNDRDKTMLGEAQWDWLEQRLLEPADVRLIVSSIQFVSDEHRFEKWNNLPRERSRMLRLIRDTGAEGVVFLSGDRHHAELSKLPGLPTGVPYPLYDLTSSGLTQSRPRPDADRRPLETNHYRVVRQVRGQHYGLVSIDWDQPDPLIHLEIRGLENEALLKQTLKLSRLQHQGQANPSVARFDTGDEPVEAVRLTVDGDHSDWPKQTPSLIAADDEHVYVRFSTPDERTLRRCGESVVVRINGDGQRNTGVQDVHSQGVDLSLEFGQPAPDGEPAWRTGPVVRRHGVGADETPIATARIDLHVEPTFASRHFELRFDRDAPDVAAAGLDQGGPVEVTVLGRNLTTGVLRPFASGRAVLPEPSERVAESTTQAEDGSLPEKPADALRFVVWNVLWAQPRENPAPFSRVFRALDADVALLQEWERDRYREADIDAWFAEHVGGEDAWSSMVTGSGGRGSGTAVVSRFPLVAKLPPHTPVEGDRWTFPARIAGAAIDTPLGRIVATSVHYKAGGFLDSGEDVRRLAEADAANRLTRALAASTTPDLVVFAGDFNMNGTTALIHRSLRGLDQDASPLTLAQPVQAGDDGLVYTFGRSANKRRLDYLAYTDATAEVVNAFVLDTQRLPRAVLDAHGLFPDDAHASDHFPVVVDLRITRQPRHRLAVEPAVTAVETSD